MRSSGSGAKRERLRLRGVDGQDGSAAAAAGEGGGRAAEDGKTQPGGEAAAAADSGRRPDAYTDVQYPVKSDSDLVKAGDSGRWPAGPERGAGGGRRRGAATSFKRVREDDAELQAFRAKHGYGRHRQHQVRHRLRAIQATGDTGSATGLCRKHSYGRRSSSTRCVRLQHQGRRSSSARCKRKQDQVHKPGTSGA